MEKITFGIRNVHYAGKTEDENGAPTYGAIKRWIGADELSIPPVGDPVKIYADDVVYYNLPINQGYEGNLNVRQVPEDFKVNHMGEYKDTNGVMIEKSDAVPQEFALLGEFQTDVGGKRFALYNVSAGRADLAGKTKQDTVDPQLFSVPITCMPTVSDGIVKATINKSDNESVYNSWFDSVYYNPSYASVYQAAITVTDGTNPVSGALVVAGDKVTKTNSSGIAKFMLANGTYDIFVSAATFTAEIDTITVTSAATTKTVTLTTA